jgi:serine/threonine protein kinase
MQRRRHRGRRHYYKYTKVLSTAGGSSKMLGTHSRIDFANSWIDDKYLMRKCLGRGGCASVWLAEEHGPNRRFVRQVAVKVFVDDLADRESFQQTSENFGADLQFLGELASTAPIVQYHTYIVRDIMVDSHNVAITVGTRGLTPDPQVTSLTAMFIVMEYADGGHLGPAYRQDVILKENSRYFDHFINICSGLNSAHHANIVHMDIKPHNILWFRRENEVKIADFGIAKHVNETAAGYLAGSLPYMSPESFSRFDAIRPARDVYALGCSFYELLTGDIPFAPQQAETLGGVQLIDAYKGLHSGADRPHAVEKASPGISLAFSNLIRQMMAINPEDRPSLSEVIKFLKKEKPRSADSTSFYHRIAKARVPVEPIYRSRYLVNPHFRRIRLKESAFFIFLTMRTQTIHKYKMMFALLEDAFSETYSICEVFGRCDFLIRVWAPSNRHKIREFCKRIIEELLEGDGDALHIMDIDDVEFLGGNHHLANEIDLVQTLIRLNEVQEHLADSEQSVHWLIRQGIFVRRTNHPVQGSRVKAFCLISNPDDNYSEADREARWSMLINALQKSDLKRTDLLLFKKAYRSVEDLRNEKSDYLISYTSPSFNLTTKLHDIIMDRLTCQRFKMTTLIATKRFFVESDKVALTQDHHSLA